MTENAEKSPSLPSKEALQKALLSECALPSFLALLLVCAYVVPVITMTSEQVVRLLLYAGLTAIVCTIVVLSLYNHWLQPIYTYLRTQNDARWTPETLGPIFYVASAFPAWQFACSVLVWTGAGAVGVTAESLTFDDFSFASGVLLWSAITSGGIICSVYLYIRFRRFLAPVRNALANDLGTPELRARWSYSLSIASKMRIAFASLILVSLIFGIAVAQQKGERKLEATITAAQAAALSDIQSLIASGKTLAEARAVVEQQNRAWIQEYVLIEGDALPDTTLLKPVELKRILESTAEVGDSLRIDTQNRFAWARLPGDPPQLLIALAANSETQESFFAAQGTFLLFIAIALTATLLVAWFITNDLKQSTQYFVNSLQRIAAGDLSSGQTFESEDEIGQLGRYLDQMTRAIQNTVFQVASAADRVEAAAELLADDSANLSQVTSEQGIHIQGITEAMDDIRGGVQHITESAQLLDESVQESSGAIQELSSVGRELNTSASDLTQRAEGTSDSIIEMIQTIRHIASNTNLLAQITADSAKSIEVMSAGIREVEASASKTQDSSKRVERTAEHGNQRVRQTIAGMEDIRGVIENAERAVKNLGLRTNEIGRILDVITNVADETNLLALNAAIIAAQAGEHGRAFSVVADEIKDLADRVLSSTKEISNVVQALQTESKNMDGVIARGGASVRSGVELAAEAGRALDEITSVTQESGVDIAEIVTAIRLHAASATRVVEEMTRISDEVERIQAAGEVQMSGSEYVLESADAVKTIAQSVYRTTAEQAKSSTHLTDTIISVQSSSNTIHSSLTDQAAACAQIVAALEKMLEMNRGTENSAQNMNLAMHDLRAQATELRRTIEQFQLTDAAQDRNATPNGLLKFNPKR